MATDIYVDSFSGVDTNGGTDMTTDAVKTISRALELCGNPITEEKTIQLQIGTCSSPRLYLEPEAMIQFVGIRGASVRVAGTPPAYTNSVGSLTIKPYGWDQPIYEDVDGLDPYGLGGTWNPGGGKPLYAQRLRFVDCSIPIKIYGLGFVGSAAGYAVEVDKGCDVTLAYCSAQNWAAAYMVHSGSKMVLENCYAFRNNMAVVAAEGGHAFFVGDVTLMNSLKYGILCYNNARATFRAWNLDHTNRFTTDIRTTTPRKEYAGMKLMARSTVVVEDKDINPTQIEAATVRIVKETLAENKAYYGVVLESGSILLGADHFSFADASHMDGRVTVPEDMQFKEGDNNNSSLID